MKELQDTDTTLHDNGSSHPFATLNQDVVMDAVESLGYRCDGCTYPLNSYENRVYQVGIEETSPLILKIYRPQRWTRAQIQEEHDFCFELQDQELSAIAPIRHKNDQSVFTYHGFHMCLFPRRGGHAPELDQAAHLEMLGRLLGRIHAIGSVTPFKHRLPICPVRLGTESIHLISTQFIPLELKSTYNNITQSIMSIILPVFENTAPETFIRVHGDCHNGNILWRDEALYFVDFDDTCQAPAVQDIWMLLSGDRSEQTQQLSPILRGYTAFRHFNFGELRLIEPLRTLRIIHYAAWLARRWEDPAFPLAFPWFNTRQYWNEHLLTLQEQLIALQAPPLSASTY
ncbi:MAG: serine/threonine protein kinase [Gammaproteobacteria bacterium]